MRCIASKSHTSALAVVAIQPQRKTSSSGKSATAIAARCNVGVAAAWPSRITRDRPSTRSSKGRGGTLAGGSARMPSQISNNMFQDAGEPAIPTAPHAAKYVSRARPRSNGSSCRAALSSRDGDSPPSPDANATWARRSSIRARLEVIDGALLRRCEE